MASSAFVDHRAYQPGDDLRRVDWNVYRRLGSLQVKLTEAPERLEVVLVLDCSASMHWGTPDKLAYATELTAALGYVALRGADVLRIVRLGSDTSAYGPARNGAHFPEVLRFLSQADAAVGGDQSLAARLASLVVPTSAPLVLVISDFLEPDLAALGGALDRLARQGADVVMIQLMSPQEEDPEALGPVELIDAETGERLDVALSLGATRRYRARLANWLGEVEALATGRGLRYVRVRTDRPADVVLLDDFRRAGLVR